MAFRSRVRVGVINDRIIQFNGLLADGVAYSDQLERLRYAVKMITVLLGAPGSGKSTWVRKNAQGFEHVYCLDGIRVNPELDIQAFSNLRRMQAIKAVENGQPLIADATHTIKAHRDVWRHLADRLGLETRVVLFDTPLATLLEVQKNREFPVKRSVVVDHHRKLQLARHAIDREGWGSIEVITR